MASPPAVRAPPARSPRSPEQIHLPDPGLPQSQKQEVASILSALDSQQTALFRYADRNYLKACFRRGFLGVQDSARRFAAQAAGNSLVNRRALKGFNTWCAFSSLRARRRRLLLGALVSLQERRLRAGLNSWKAQRAERELALERLSQGARQWVSRAVGRACRKWAEGVAKRARMRACARSVADSRSRRAMNGWMASAYERGERARRMGGALASLRGRHSRRALNRWAGDARRRRAATRHLSAATMRWVGRATAAAYRTWAADVQTRARLRGCVETVRDSRVRRVVNTWAEEGAARARREQSVRQSLVSLRESQSRRAMNTMKGALAVHAVARGAAASLLHGKLRRAHNTWARRAGGGSADARRLRLAAMEWTSVGLRRGWYRWRGLVLMRSTQLGPAMAPPSSFALRTMMWMRERGATVQQQLVLAAGDEKYMCVRMLLKPHAALVFHANGAMLRVVRVRGHPTAMCAVDLAAGEENRLLSVKERTSPPLLPFPLRRPRPHPLRPHHPAPRRICPSRD
ncbi:hypothetical protein AB1Y20_019328 [Prymnesium parvum]|uniref:Uncharacterized protein n=1 Tax=Prymnesium parvum TaxID=97485 RepID=A0AB34JQV1_PRYPA